MTARIDSGKTETIVILSPGFPKDESDSTCMTSQQSFVREVNKTFPGLKVIIITFQYPYRNKSYRWFGNEVIPADAKKMTKALRPIVWLRILRMLNRIHQENEVVGLLSFWCNETALVGNYFARSKRIRHLIWILGQDAKADNFFVRLINPKPDSLVALSQFVKTEFEKNHGITPAYLIPNGVNKHMFDSGAIEKDIDIIGVGSLTNLKRYDLLIQLVKDLSPQFPALKVLLVGDGEQRKELEEQVESCELGKILTFVGEIEHREVVSLMKRSKILIHPSSYEGYSTVCLEALASGCHVVSFFSAQDQMIPHWHVASHSKSMKIFCEEILKHEKDFKPVIVHTMDDSARQMVNLLLGYPS